MGEVGNGVRVGSPGAMRTVSPSAITTKFLEVKARLLKLADADEEFGNVVRHTLEVIGEALDRFGPLGLALSFNGGKDACVVFYLLMVVLAERNQVHLLTGAGREGMAVIYFEKEEFPAVQDFMREMGDSFGISYHNYNTSYKEGMQDLVDSHGIKAALMGQRYGDPQTDGMEAFTPSTPGWPNFFRVNPVLDWKYRHVWRLLRECELPYCCLYDEGYTSLGEATLTERNSALLLADGTYKAAFELSEENLERSCRTPTSVASEPSPPYSNSGSFGSNNQPSFSSKKKVHSTWDEKWESVELSDEEVGGDETSSDCVDSSGANIGRIDNAVHGCGVEEFADRRLGTEALPKVKVLPGVENSGAAIKMAGKPGPCVCPHREDGRGKMGGRGSGGAVGVAGLVGRWLPLALFVSIAIGVLGSRRGDGGVSQEVNGET